VAAGIGPFAIGSDGGGSIRIPSSFCGLYGFKASFGRVPLYPGCRDERFPGVSSWESIEHIGPISRTVADSALMLSVIAGPDDRDRHSLPNPKLDWVGATAGGIAGFRVAYSPDWGYAAVDPGVRAVVDRAVTVFERELGCSVELANPGFADARDAFEAIVALESDLAGMRALADRLGERMTPSLRTFLSRPWTAEDFTGAVMARKAVTNAMWKFMRRYDLLLTPTLAVPPFAAGSSGPSEIDGREVRPGNWSPFTFPMNLTGQPAATIPAGWTTEGLPIGLQIVGPHLGDEKVLRASAAFEAASPWADRWPTVC
jgi:aspartyl-tRNA(Asn)/glutamyl-tRNA(Gln) amidotransferase subunit A